MEASVFLLLIQYLSLPKPAKKLSRTVKFLKSSGSCPRTPTRLRLVKKALFFISSPSIIIFPLSAANCPVNIFIRVVLPAPFSPKRAWIVPDSIMKDIYEDICL